MTEQNSKSWRINRQINISILIQLVFLAALIIGTWVNLQQQIVVLQHDVTMLLESNRQFQKKLDTLSANSISHDYRLRAIEKALAKADNSQKKI